MKSLGIFYFLFLSLLACKESPVNKAGSHENQYKKVSITQDDFDNNRIEIERELPKVKFLNQNSILEEIKNNSLSYTEKMLSFRLTKFIHSQASHKMMIFKVKLHNTFGEDLNISLKSIVSENSVVDSRDNLSLEELKFYLQDFI